MIRRLILFFMVGQLFTGQLVWATSFASVDSQIRRADATGQGTALLDRERFEYEKQLEKEKLSVEREKAWLSGLAIGLPLLAGIGTLYWQTRAANKLKDRDSRDAFELKAAEIVFIGDNTRATKNRAKALTVLFPERFPKNFGDAFEPAQFGGPRFDAKVEVFRAACSKVSSTQEVYQIWHEIFPTDTWILPLVGKGDGQQSDGGVA